MKEASMKIEKVIVVEGKNDVLAVKRAVDADVVITSGSGLNPGIFKMLKTLHDERGLIVLTDPDGPGERIRSLIQEQIPTVDHAFIQKSDALVNDDIGIENASIETIRNALKHYLVYSEDQIDIAMSDLIDLNLQGHAHAKAYRQQLCATLKITYCNSKTLLQRLKMLKIDAQQLKTIMEELHEANR